MSWWTWGRAVANPRRTWALLLAVLLGMLVSIVLVSMMPLYSSLVAESYLQHTLATSSPSAINVEITGNSVGILPDIVDSTTKNMDSVAQHLLAGFTRGSTTYLEAWRTSLRFDQVNGANPVASGVLPGPFDQATALGYDMSQAGPHMQLIAGRLPQDTPAGQPVEVLVTKQMDKLHVGDTLALSVSGIPALQVSARVAGIWYPKDAGDPFWNGRSFAEIEPRAQDSPPTPAIFPLLFTKNGFVSALRFSSGSDGTQVTGPVGMTIHSIYFTAPATITPESAQTVVDRLKNMHTLVPVLVQGSSHILEAGVVTNLDAILSGALQQTALIGLPFDIVVVQILGLSLLFVITVTGILVDRQAVQIATLKSRGASLPQLLGGYGLQGIILAALAALPAPVLAPALALGIVSRLLPSGSGGLRIEQQYLVGIATAQSILIPILIGMGLGVLALLVAVVQAARLDVLSLRREQGRSTGVPFWKRYYLDVALAVLCAAGYLELVTFGGLGTRTTLASSGAVNTPDPLLFATPSLLLLAGALLALRGFPLAAQTGTWGAARDRGATGMLAFAQVARGVGGLARLTLLLTLALSFGLFALTFQSSLARNSADQAAYLVGGDERVQLIQGSPTSPSLADRYAKLPGVTQLMSAYRTHGSPLGGTALDANILALDPAHAAQVVYWRDDYAARSLAQLMAQLQTHAQGASAGSPDHPIWALVDSSLAASQHVGIGDRFKLASETGQGAITYVVGDIVTYFPTMFDAGSQGYLIVNLADYNAAVASPQLGAGVANGPNEFWLRTTDDPAQTAARSAAWREGSYSVNSVTSRRTLTTQFQSDPLQTGIIGLLLLGAATAALLALVGTIVQAALSAGQRTLQFAVLRTLGMSTAQLLRMLLAEQAIVYTFGLIGGTLLGIVLTQLTLPFLQVSSAPLASGESGIPPNLLVFNLQGSAIFYGVLLVAFVLGPLLMTRLATALRLGRTLRIGED